MESLTIKLLKRHIMSNKILSKSYNFKYHTQKHKLDDILKEIIYILKTGISYRNLRSNINYNTIYYNYCKLNRYKIFELSFKDLMKKYLKRTKNRTLKIISTDTSFISNKNGKDNIGYNKYYSKKNGNKISLIVDKKGFPLNVKIYNGKINDSKIFMKQINDYNIDNNNEIKYFLCDKGYDSKEIDNKLKDLNYIPLILQNKRGIKDKNKLRKFSSDEGKIYSNRMRVENSFCKLKQLRRINLRYDCKIENYLGYIYLGIILKFI